MIRVIYDNKSVSPLLAPAWGFSCVVDGFDSTVLFDTGGDGALLMDNMRGMAISPGDIDVVVLSHEHWDHIGGLEMFLGRNPGTSVVLPSDFSSDFKEDLRNKGSDVVEVDKPFEICPGICTTRVLRNGRIPELGMCVRGMDGGCGVLVTGCAHPGVASVVASVKDDLGGDNFAAIGGFHLKDSSRLEVERVIDDLTEQGVCGVGPCHCTGDDAIMMMKGADVLSFVDVRAGVELPFDLC